MADCGPECWVGGLRGLDFSTKHFLEGYLRPCKLESRFLLSWRTKPSISQKEIIMIRIDWYMVNLFMMRDGKSFPRLQIIFPMNITTQMLHEHECVYQWSCTLNKSTTCGYLWSIWLYTLNISRLKHKEIQCFSQVRDLVRMARATEPRPHWAFDIEVWRYHKGPHATCCYSGGLMIP